MLKIGVVGVGHLGQHHARVLNEIENCKLIGIYDKDLARGELISQRLNTKMFASFEALLNEVDAVDISATTTYHYELASKALKMGKHVFVEKPITAELEQAEKLLELADSKKLKLQVGHIERFNPTVMKAIDDIDNPRFIESNRIAPFNPRGSDVPVVLDLMIHDIDLILSFVHSKIKDIKASGVGILTSSIDIANARVEFENGTIANVTSSRISMKQERKIRFFQKDAYITLDFKDKKVSVLKKSKNLNKILPQILLGNSKFDPNDLVDITNIDASNNAKDALTMELESFVNCIINNTKPIVDGYAGTRALRIALEIVNLIYSKNEQEIK